MLSKYVGLSGRQPIRPQGCLCMKLFAWTAVNGGRDSEVLDCGGHDRGRAFVRSIQGQSGMYKSI